jgi:ribonuclease-3
LQELLQAISPVSPVYPIVAAAGPEHQKRFVARVTWSGMDLGRGEGSSKKEAETEAARDALSKGLWRRSKGVKQEASAGPEKDGNNPPTTADKNQ